MKSSYSIEILIFIRGRRFMAGRTAIGPPEFPCIRVGEGPILYPCHGMRESPFAGYTAALTDGVLSLLLLDPPPGEI